VITARTPTVTFLCDALRLSMHMDQVPVHHLLGIRYGFLATPDLDVTNRRKAASD